MAGNWADVPSRKIPYHNDGTLVFGRYPLEGAPYEQYHEWAVGDPDEANDLDFTPIPGGGVTNWNNKRFPAVGRIAQISVRQAQNVWIFPEPRDIYGVIGTFNVAFSSTKFPSVVVATSTDTTNGADGTWTNRVTWNETNMLRETVPEAWRSAIAVFTAPGVRGVRTWGFAGTFGDEPLLFRSFFIFGVIAAGETPDRILFVDNNTGLEFTKPMDWGDVPRGTTLDWDIYLLNNSSTLQANTMVLDFTTGFGTADTWFTINDSGGAFGTTANITAIAAAARYPAADVFTVRLAVPDGEPLAIYEAALELSTAVSWT